MFYKILNTFDSFLLFFCFFICNKKKILSLKYLAKLRKRIQNVIAIETGR